MEKKLKSWENIVCAEQKARAKKKETSENTDLGRRKRNERLRRKRQ
jgi:hypothetical protein